MIIAAARRTRATRSAVSLGSGGADGTPRALARSAKRRASCSHSLELPGRRSTNLFISSRSLRASATCGQFRQPTDRPIVDALVVPGASSNCWLAYRFVTGDELFSAAPVTGNETCSSRTSSRAPGQLRIPPRSGLSRIEREHQQIWLFSLAKRHRGEAQALDQRRFARLASSLRTRHHASVRLLDAHV